MSRPDRLVAAFGVLVVGLAIGTAHWLGVLLGAALFAQFGRSVRSGVALGTAFGVLTAAAFVVELLAYGHFDRFLATGELAALPIAIAIGLGAVGGLTRGLR
ncbi:MAG: hypothetical protein ACQETB_08565 [Halobacteriota archaeon]